jgi:hypothetical protein
MTARLGITLIAVTVPLAGCGGGPKPVPVSGLVTLDNKPLANATLQFVPVSGPSEAAYQVSSVGTTGEDGRYTLVLNSDSNSKGAVAGKYKVIITLGAQPGTETKHTFHKQLPEKYNRKTELECDIPPGGRDDANFSLLSK